MAHSSQIEDEVDALYDLRPGEFVAARDALARQVRRAGDREQAERIKALQRPSAAAWAVNQLARREPEWTQALTTAGRRMADAHTALLEDGDREGWRKASQEAREAIERLVRLAEGLLREERGSVSNQLREQVRDTLQAAATDPAARELVAAGRLTRELRPPGGLPDVPIGGGRFTRPSGTGPRGTAARSRPRAAPTPTPTPTTAKPTTGAAAEREARTARRAAERDARAQLRRAEKERASAEVVAERAQQALVRAQKAREAAAEELATAQQADAQRAAELEAAQAAQADAQALLEAREQAVEEARATLDTAADEAD
jgi:hypothetical protein